MMMSIEHNLISFHAVLLLPITFLETNFPSILSSSPFIGFFPGDEEDDPEDGVNGEEDDRPASRAVTLIRGLSFMGFLLLLLTTARVTVVDPFVDDDLILLLFVDLDVNQGLDADTPIDVPMVISFGELFDDPPTIPPPLVLEFGLMNSSSFDAAATGADSKIGVHDPRECSSDPCI